MLEILFGEATLFFSHRLVILGKVKKKCGSGPRAHDFYLAHGTFLFYFSVYAFREKQFLWNNSYEEKKNEKSYPCILSIPCLGLGM